MKFFNFKKKEPKEKKYKYSGFTEYNRWSDDIGFLIYLIDIKKTRIKNFIIDAKSEQLKYGAIKEEDVLKNLDKYIYDIMDSLSPDYKKFLNNYFNGEDGLVKFITEEMYSYIVSESTSRNLQKIQDTVSAKIIKRYSGES